MSEDDKSLAYFITEHTGGLIDVELLGTGFRIKGTVAFVKRGVIGIDTKGRARSEDLVCVNLRAIALFSFPAQRSD